MDKLNLEKLNDEIKTFSLLQNNSHNIFRILKIRDREIHHSNFLAWMMDFKLNPEIAPILLNLLFGKILQNSIQDLNNLGVDRFSFSEKTLQVVYREKFHTDIILEFPSEKNIVVFENKIYAQESEGQLIRYRQEVTDYYSKINKNHKFIFIYLTLSNDIPSDPSWHPVGFDTLLDILRTIKEQLKVHVYILDYIKILEEDLMGKESTEKRELGLKIIKEFPEELKYLLDLSIDIEDFKISSRKKGTSSLKDKKSLTSVIHDSIMSNQFVQEIEIIRVSKNFINFLTPSIHSIVGNHGTGEWLGKKSKHWVSFEFNSKNPKDFRLILVIGPTNRQLNQRLTKFLMSHSIFEGKTLFVKNNKIINDIFNSVNIFSYPIPANSTVDETRSIIDGQIKSFFNEKLPIFNRYFQFHSTSIDKIIENKD